MPLLLLSLPLGLSGFEVFIIGLSSFIFLIYHSSLGLCLDMKFSVRTQQSGHDSVMA